MARGGEQLEMVRKRRFPIAEPTREVVSIELRQR
jgi:hypothetical protein